MMEGRLNPHWRETHAGEKICIMIKGASGNLCQKVINLLIFHQQSKIRHNDSGTPSIFDRRGC